MINSKNKIIFLMFSAALIAILLLFLAGCSQKQAGAQSAANENKEAESAAVQAAEQEMVVCDMNKDPSCFLNRMNQCLPVTAQMLSSDGEISIEVTVLGQVNDTCHFQRKMNDVLDLDCYFPRGTMNVDTLGQTFGNDKGLQSVVDSACKIVGW